MGEEGILANLLLFSVAAWKNALFSYLKPNLSFYSLQHLTYLGRGGKSHSSPVSVALF